MDNNPFTNLDPIDLGRKNSLDWVENSYLSDSSNKLSIQDGFLSLSLSRKKIKLFFLIIIVFLILVLLKSFWLQIIAGDRFFALAENNRIKTQYFKAHRGIIYDRNGKALVNNLFGFSISIVPSELPKDEVEKNKILERISSIIQIPRQEILDKIKVAESRYFQPILIRTGIPYDQAILLKIDNLSGVRLDIDSWRLYLGGESFSHLLGYIGKISPEEYESLKSEYLLDDNIGKTGLEKQYEKYLRGIHGQKKIEVDALGREKKIISQKEPVSGDSLILSLDAELQEKVYLIMKEKIPQGKGSVIISDPRDGSILALVDYPSYDNNLFTGGINISEYNKLLNDQRKPLFTRSILGEYPSGSTIKPVIAAAALQEGLVSKNTTVNSLGGIYVGQWFFPDWKSGGHGITNITKAIAWSVNTYFYYVGGGYGNFKGLGLNGLVKYFKMFGLNEPTGIDLPGERSGFIPTAEWKKEKTGEDWYIGDTYHLSIGQGDLLVTPIQVNNYTSAIANDGKLYVPHLAKGIIHPNGTKEDFSPKLIRNIAIDLENFKIVKEGMRETVSYGSAHSLNSLPIKVAGKTGTAQWRKDKPNHAWFTGFAPYDNPNFVITVLVEEGGEGSSVAVPIAKEIISWWFTNRN